jgi:hypothetical protein
VNYKLFNPFDDFEITKTVWIDLLKRCDSSFFTSWEWISTWLNSLPKDTNLQFVVGYLAEQPMLAFFIGRRRRRRYGFLPTKAIVLNATGNPYFDKLTIEYNSMLVDTRAIPEKDSLFGFLATLPWNEFVLSGVSQQFVSNFDLLGNSNRYFPVITDRISESHLVDLQKIRESRMDYLGLLSANRRSQIRRSIKEYEKDGKIQCQQAASSEEALSMLNELAALHEQVWRNRGMTGAFSNKYFHQFHNDLILNHFDTGNIQLLHIFNERETLGYLYNFIHCRKVLFYQSGLNYSAGNQYRPGLVSHYFAILHNAAQNMDSYDFLAGDADYKKSLGTNSLPMYWIRLIKNNSRYRLETNAIRIKQTIKTFLKRREAA